MKKCLKFLPNNGIIYQKIYFYGETMKNYRVESWTMRQIAMAMTTEDDSGRRIVIPVFQRGKRWESDKKTLFINSLLQHFPVGALLLSDQGNKTYSIVDGLQRGTTICEYILHPTKGDNLKSIDTCTLNLIRLELFPYSENIGINSKIEEEIVAYLETKNNFDDIDMSELADLLYDKFANLNDYRLCTTKIKEILKGWFTQYKREYNTIAETEIPIIVYLGSPELLSEIFKRINKQGITLTEYEIFAAIWSQEKFIVNKDGIINYVLKKYDRLSNDNYTIDGYDPNEIRTNKKLTVFEFLFGVSKYWIENFNCLKTEKSSLDDVVDSIGFELIDACINDTKSIADLDKKLQHFNINYLERRIEEAINFVSLSIASISNFKGNCRTARVLHAKYQIISLIAYIFREMYDIKDLTHKRPGWDSNKDIIRTRIKQYYVYDILSNEWHDGGVNKVYTKLRELTFNEEIAPSRWKTLLDNIFEESVMRKETTKIKSPSTSDIIFLNCIYADIFTANDQLSCRKFDIEHIATKAKLKDLIKVTHSTGLPISCIGNLCYLPEKINRSKGAKTFYDDKELSISIEQIESKYSFTQKSNLDWLLEHSYGENDSNTLKNLYIDFLRNRFQIQKKKFLDFIYTS